MFQSKPMSSVEKSVKMRKFFSRNRKLRVVVYKFYATAAISLFTLIMVCGVILEVNGIIRHENPLNTATAQISGNNEVSIQEYVFKRVEAELGFESAVKAVSMIGGCENKQWSTEATLVNKGGSIDRGLWQINNKFHPEVSSACAFDKECSTTEAIRIIKERGFKEWTCGKNL